MKRHTCKKGFTLVELSIVLTIIALLVGGVLVGESLIRAFQIRSVVTELTTYSRLINQFKDKFSGFPGDLYNATNFWGEESSCPNAPYTAAPHTITCNGNGNGKIAEATGLVVTPTPQELFRAWQHLANAGLLTREYSGITGPASVYNSVINVNVPASKWPGAGYTLYYQDVAPPGTVNNWPNYGHVLLLGGETISSTQGMVFTPLDVMDIDTKIDDGLPATGRVLVSKPNFRPNCTTSDDATLSRYNVAYSDLACAFVYTMN